MSLTVRHLNGDSTFLLIFSPESHPAPSDLLSANGAYSVLIDPWITGSSIVNAKWFAVTDRLEPSAISHLSELDEPDVVICSQNKPDHTHKETLLQLNPEGKTIFAAEPGAARAIKSWNYFDPNRVYSLAKYDPKAKFGNSLRLYIPPLSYEGLPGELVITFIPAKNYVTGLHNAIGITYQAPTRLKALAPVATIDLPKPKLFHLPLSPVAVPGVPSPQASPTYPYYPPSTMDSLETIVPSKQARRCAPMHRPQLSRSSNTASSELLSFPYQPSIHPSLENLRPQHVDVISKPVPTIRISDDEKGVLPVALSLPTPPDSPHSPAQATMTTPTQPSSFTPKSSISSMSNTSDTPSRQRSRTLSTSNKPPSIHPARPKAISVLYSPHGIDTSDIKPYVQNHLIRLPGALPLTLLLHSFEYAQNPWYFGGNIMKGAAGGMDIAKLLMARCWISAHDEPKEKRGVSVKLLKTEQTAAEEIRRELANDEDGRGHGWVCDVRILPCGKELVLSSGERDLLVGPFCQDVKQGTGVGDTTFIQRSLVDTGG